ncbi:MAG: universal stress protein [Bacteroidota bacterium]
MKTIVSPTDFSALSLNAANYAADMACVLGTNLALIHVCPIPVTLSDVPVPSYPLEDLISDAEKNIAALKGRLLARTGGRITILTEVGMGFIIPQLNEYCARLDPYAVVMGTERANGFERMIAGATTFSAMSQLSWPVITVPDGAEFRGLRKVGLACDLKNVTETLPVAEIKSLVKEFHAEFHVLHVDGGAVSFTPEEVSESVALQEMLGDLLPIYHFMDGSDVETTICEFAEKHDFDMLFVFPKKHTILSKILNHSHSKRLVLQTHIPVLSLHE